MGITGSTPRIEAERPRTSNEIRANTVKDGAPGGRPSRCARELGWACLELGVSLDNQIAHTSLRGDIVDRSQEREAAPLPFTEY
jgi:hypothetical protein